MEKLFTSLGLMSGTSMDGIDASVIKSDGKREFTIIYDKYFKYSDKLHDNLVNLRDMILREDDLETNSKNLKIIEREITVFHAEIVNSIISSLNDKVELIGFHGQTIYHNSKSKISKQLGDGYLLSQLTKKSVIYDFRKNDLKNGGEGAPLSPIYHNAIVNKYLKHELEKKKIFILNIGGISNVTKTAKWNNLHDEDLKITAKDIGPGNCLIDEWIRKNSNKNFDENGMYAFSGNTDKLILNQALEIFEYNKNSNKSLDIKDFDLSFVRGLSIEDGASTLTDFTSEIISRFIINESNANSIWIICGGGRKNNYLMRSIKKNINNSNKKIFINLSEDYNINGDFVESQAFAYLAIRSFLKLPISFPKTTYCQKPLIGGTLVSNY